MHTRKIISFVLTVCFLEPAWHIATAQTAGGGQQLPREYSSGMIIKKDRKRHEGNRLVFTAETLTFVDRQSGQSMALPLEDVEFVSATTGNHALEGALIGGGICLLASLEAVAEVSADPTRKLKENAGEIVAIVTAAGAGVGLLIGAAITKEATVFQKGKLVLLPGAPEPTRVAMPGNIPLLSLKLNL